MNRFSRISEWFWELSDGWQLVVLFGSSTIVGIGAGFGLTTLVPMEWRSIVGMLFCMAGLGCLVIGMIKVSKIK